MANSFKDSDILKQLKKELHEKEDRIFRENIVPYEQWSEMDKANQRYVDGIRRACAEYHEKYGEEDND